MGSARKFKSHFNVPTERPSKGRLFAVCLMVGSGLFLVLSFLSPTKRQIQGPVPSQLKTPEYNNRVNEHLKMTANKIFQDQQVSKFDSNNAGPEKLNQKKQTPLLAPETQNLELTPDNQWEELSKRLNPQETGQDSSVAQDIQYELFEQQKNSELSLAYKTEYARQFVENARKHGYQIELSSDFKIISVKKIIKKNSPSLFEAPSESN